MQNKDNFSYKITVQYPETNKVVKYTFFSIERIPIYDVPNVAVDRGVILLNDIDYITSISEEEITTESSTLIQAEQIVLRPRESSGTSRQFSHLMKDLHITDDDYMLLLDIGNITKDEVTINIYPSIIGDLPNHEMSCHTIKQIIAILNLNSKKTVTVNYILLDDLKKLTNLEQNDNDDDYIDSCDSCNDECCSDCDCKTCIEHPENPCHDKSDCVVDCCDECECKNNPKTECCKGCDMVEDCGCYITKVRKLNKSKNNQSDIPEKTLRIPVEPINPKEEIFMLARAIAKRLDILAVNSEVINATICVDKSKLDKTITVNIKTSTDFLL